MSCLAGTVRRQVCAWLTIATMAFVSAGPAVFGHAGEDIGCALPSVTAHDHSAHRLRTAPEPAPDHCGVCHLTRSVRGAALVAVIHTAAPLDKFELPVSANTPQHIVLRNWDPRGPPSLI